MFNFTTLPPLSLYIHIPWCLRKCPYCDFNSHAGTFDERAYVEALTADLARDLPRVWGRQVQSVFIGGGTPSLFSAEALDQLLSAVRAMVKLQPLAEITLEANPGTAEAGRFREYRALGIDRLSIGVQSFDDEALARLGRVHDGREARRAVELAHAAGFERINLDLMFALPGQTRAQALEDLETALALEPGHLSHYQLTLEPNTLFHACPPANLPDDDDAWAIQQACLERLAAAGYDHYEVSAHARPGHHCRHNLNYWEFGDYLGIGAGAHAKISEGATHTITRLAKPRHPEAYMAGEAASERRLDADDAALEFMMNALRLREGFAPHLFSDHTGLPLSRIEPALREAEARGLIEWTIHRICPTERGWRFLNDLLALFDEAAPVRK